MTVPDILFSAADHADGPNGINFNIPVRRFSSSGQENSLTFNAANALAGLAGPGTIEPGARIVYNKVGPIFAQGSLYYPFLSGAGFINEGGETNHIPLLQW